MDKKLDLDAVEKKDSNKIPVSVWIKTITLILVWMCMVSFGVTNNRVL